MKKLLITSGPTRQYIDPVRYMSNASSGTMGKCLAQAALDNGFEVIVVSGPVQVTYPENARVVPVVSTEEMLAACLEFLPDCVGVIGAAAPCDYRPVDVADHKLRKTGEALVLRLVETEDIMATLGRQKQNGQWTVAFALETEDARFRAITKLEKKSCDLVVLNGATAIDSDSNSIEILEPSGDIVATATGPKTMVAEVILQTIVKRLMP